MTNKQKKLPLNITQSNYFYYTILVILIFGALLLIDGPVTIAVANLPEQIIAPFEIITRAGNSDWILIPSLLGAIIALILLKLKFTANFQQIYKKLFVVSSFIFTSVAIPGIIAFQLKFALGRARPISFEEFGVLYFQPFSNWEFQSFPSGDTTTIFSLFVALAFLMPRFKWLFLFAAILVGLSRIMIGVHFPSDVFGGILLGTFGAYAVRNYFLHKGWLVF